jgi:hypothetical protein
MAEFDETTVEVTTTPRVDEEVAPGITVRRGHPLGAQLFVGGWRVGFYKTEAGLTRAIARHRADRVADEIVYRFRVLQGMTADEFASDPGGWLSYSGEFRDVDDETAAAAIALALAEWDERTV